ncbi:hypothetical protein Tco_1530928 [Tanacetum coccineum]
MNNLETLLNAETLHEMDSKSALSVIKIQQFKFKIQSSLQRKEDETSSGDFSDKKIDNRNWKHITVTWQRFRSVLTGGIKF